MCGMYGHGFWWVNKDREYEVMFDFEINCHSRIQEENHQIEIPTEANRCGFDPINGEPVTNEDVPLPEKVKEKIKMLFEAYYPNKECIAEWIKNNYAENYDKPEWDIKLLEMLNDKGTGFFNLQYYKHEIESCERMIKNHSFIVELHRQDVGRCEREVEKGKNYIEKHDNWIGRLLHKDKIKRCKGDIVFYRKEIRWYNRDIKFYKDWIKESNHIKKEHENRIKNCTGSLTEMDIDKFVEYFLEHPNDYWSGKNQKREVEYKQFVEI